MGSTLVLAIWIASNANFQAALPRRAYQIRQYANSDDGIDDFMKWVDKPGHDQIDLIASPPLPARRSRARRSSGATQRSNASSS